MKSNKRTLLGFAAGIMAGVSYGLNPLFGKPLLEGGVPVLSMLFFRYAISALLLGGWMLLRKVTFKATWKEFQLLIVLGILFAASSVTLFESYKFIPAGLATTLVYLYPIFVAVIMLFLKVYPTWQVWLSIAATVGGVVVLSWPGGGVTDVLRLGSRSDIVFRVSNHRWDTYPSRHRPAIGGAESHRIGHLPHDDFDADHFDVNPLDRPDKDSGLGCI